MSDTVIRETVFVVIRESILKSWATDASTLALATALIIPGWLIGSSAAQWLGFMVFFVMMVGKSKTKRLTIAEARAELDRIEKEMAL